MLKAISFEGCIGAGKTNLTTYFAHELKMEYVLEQYEENPFLKKFYKGLDVKLETELTFLLMHYSQLKKTIRDMKDGIILADFSIEKDLVYARLNLTRDELSVFENVYDMVINEVGIPEIVIYLELSFETLRKRVLQRGRTYEIKVKNAYLKGFSDKLRMHFLNESESNVYLFNVDDLKIDPNNETIGQIRDIIQKAVGGL